jgi:hypothetical protein
LEIWKSLCIFTKSKYFLFSWDILEYKSNIIMDKVDMENTIGKWDTMNDLWNRTNGKSGHRLDFHWSPEYARMFANYLFNKITSHTTH